MATLCFKRPDPMSASPFFFPHERLEYDFHFFSYLLVSPYLLRLIGDQSVVRPSIGKNWPFWLIRTFQFEKCECMGNFYGTFFSPFLLLPSLYLAHLISGNPFQRPYETILQHFCIANRLSCMMVSPHVALQHPHQTIHFFLLFTTSFH